MSYLKNLTKTNITLSTTEALFIDFKRKTFAEEIAIPKYLELNLFLKKKDK